MLCVVGCVWFVRLFVVDVVCCWDVLLVVVGCELLVVCCLIVVGAAVQFWHCCLTLFLVLAVCC